MTGRDNQFSARGLDALIRDLRTDLRSVRGEKHPRHPREDDLLAVGTGALATADKELVQEHLDVCTRCASRISAFRSAAKAWEGPDASERLDALRKRLRL